MKLVVTMLALGAALGLGARGAQEGMMPPPKELNAIYFLVGNFACDMLMYPPGQTTGTPFKSTLTATKSLNGMWIETRFDADMGGMPMKGLQMTSYDPDRKEYIAYWFDSMGPGGLEMRGKLKGQTLVLSSKMEKFPGMPGPMAFRATNSLKGDGKVLFRLEMNQGKGWMKMLEGTMNRQ